MSSLSNRKLQHIDIVRKQEVEPLASPFDGHKLPYRALPELDMADVSMASTFLGYKLSFPLLISSMTGGPEKAGTINRHLAMAAQREKVALGLGSMRVCLTRPETIVSFKVRELCPDVPLLANMGLVQLNYGFGADDINRLVDLVGADGIYLHVNALQEAIQPEGDTNFKGLLAKLAALVPKIKVPILIKEVGSGIDPVSARRLLETGVTWIDVAGMGGTSWSLVEGYRREDRLGHLFRDVGITTDQALLAARDLPGIQLIASGGVRSGLDMVKALMLGAQLVGSAKPFLEPAIEGPDAVAATIQDWRMELKTAMFCCGLKNIASLYKQL